MSAFSIHAADVVQSMRFSTARYSKHKISFPLSILQFLGSIWLILRIVELVNTSNAPIAMPITPGSLLFAAFMIALGKGAIDGYNRMVRNPSLVFLLQQPLSRRSIVAAKLATVFSFNLAFVALALGSATAMIAGLHMQIPATGLFIPSLVLAAIGGLASGFAFSVAASLSTWRKKITGLASLAVVPAIAWLVLVQNEPPLGNMFAFLLAVVPPTMASAFGTSEWLAEAWNVQTSSPGKSGLRSSRAFRLPWMTEPEAALFDKEIKTAWRRREITISIATLILLTVALASVDLFLGGPPAGPLARFTLPALAMAGAYIGAALVLTSKGLSSIGGEFDSIWIVRTAPVNGHAVAVGKVSAYLIVVPAVVAVTLPLSLMAGLPWAVTVMLAFGALVVSFLMIAVGLYFGARSPSFDRNTGGLPDSFTMYAVFILGLIACVVVFAPAPLVFMNDRVLGVLVAILMADLSALLLTFVVRIAGNRIDALEV